MVHINYSKGHTFCGKCGIVSYEGLDRCDQCNNKMRRRPHTGRSKRMIAMDDAMYSRYC